MGPVPKSNQKDLRQINRQLHEHPETAYEEVFAHQTLTDFLSSRGFTVQRSTYGLPTSFEAEIGSGGRIVVICAEYDALPQIGHACGHNLIATSSVATFIAAAAALDELQKQNPDFQGRLRILGTPAEEGGGGKAKLIDAGALADKDIAVAIMAHPVGPFQLFARNSSSEEGAKNYTGLAGFRLIASHKFRTEFRGRTAHAAGEPWKGRNALDAAVAAYSSVGLLRQQIEPDERVHAVIEVGGTVPNVIPEYTRMNWNVRSPTMARADTLLDRVKACIGAAAMATGCELEYLVSPTYMNLRVNNTLCEAYVADMAALGENVMLKQGKAMHASTDMGNFSHIVPSFHGAFVIPSTEDVAIHNPGFTAAAGTDAAHESALKCANGMAMLAVRVLVDGEFAERAWQDFRHLDE
ncbi:metal-dependent amidase/aminoacylase/carboxypeptidase [Microdochium bolleyi]|uniref:Peptidase M20 domain-containing protein 2 n=1 Tax=Microdochium bolleyi TaxID=196109 RepID=A0A136IQB7_9PEZI|nr:metal-dependent amidase/aminoacylase/carboxypeptidase [Microdochium bolleyi]